MTVWSSVWRGVSGSVVRINGRPRGASITSRLTTSPSCRARCWLSTTSSDNEQRQQQLVVSTVYVHPLSQIVLQYLQKECHDWICARQLDGNLRLHRDGTFVLETMTTTNDSSTDITKQQQQSKEQEASADENETESSSDDDDDDDDAISSYSASTTNAMTTTKTRIWTYYDLADKKHWLSYSSSIVPAAATSSGDIDENGGDTTKAEDKASLSNNTNSSTTTRSSQQHQTTMSSSNCQHSFLLQDNMMPAWHGNHRRTSLVDRVQESVRELLQVADQEHAKQQQALQHAASSRSSSADPSQANKTNKKKKLDNNTDE